MSKKSLLLGLVGVLALAAIIAYTQLTIFVIQPIGAVPEGRVLILKKSEKLKFVDSADAYCERNQGYVNLICRIAVLGKVANSDAILMRLPYSETLYLLSTGGETYSSR